MRLDGEHDGIVAAQRFVGRGRRCNTELIVRAGAGVFVDVDGVEIRRGDAAFDQAADQCGGHVAAADECDFHGECSSESSGRL